MFETHLPEPFCVRVEGGGGVVVMVHGSRACLVGRGGFPGLLGGGWCLAVSVGCWMLGVLTAVWKNVVFFWVAFS